MFNIFQSFDLQLLFSAGKDKLSSRPERALRYTGVHQDPSLY